MNKSMLVNIINSIKFDSIIKTKTESDGTIIQHVQSHIQLPAPKPASAPILTEPKGFELVFEKNNRIKIADVKRHEDASCVYITYKEYDSDGNLITCHRDKHGNVIEYVTEVFDWHETMRKFSPAFCAATNISVQHEPEMYICRFLAAAMTAFKKQPNEFKRSIDLYNSTMIEFNAVIENIAAGIANIQSDLLHKLEEQKNETEEFKTMLRQVADMLAERGEHAGVVADIRGSLDYPVEERYPHTNAGTPTHHRRRSRKEADAANAANENK